MPSIRQSFSKYSNQYKKPPKMSEEITTKQAVLQFVEALKQDKELYNRTRDNLARTFYAEVQHRMKNELFSGDILMLNEVSYDAASNFLNSLIYETVRADL